MGGPYPGSPWHEESNSPTQELRRDALRILPECVPAGLPRFGSRRTSRINRPGKAFRERGNSAFPREAASVCAAHGTVCALKLGAGRLERRRPASSRLLYHEIPDRQSSRKTERYRGRDGNRKAGSAASLTMLRALPAAWLAAAACRLLRSSLFCASAGAPPQKLADSRRDGGLRAVRPALPRLGQLFRLLVFALGLGAGLLAGEHRIQLCFELAVDIGAEADVHALHHARFVDQH